jgi:glutathione S-transferase
MPKLFYAPASPYSCKVRMAAAYADIALELIKTDTNADPAELLQVNPLGKIPTLATDDGGSVHDSRAITQYFNRLSKNALYPRNPEKRLDAEKLEALADGICDSLLAHVYERRFRPEEKVHQPWLDRLWSKVARSLDELEAAPPKLTGKLHAGQMALRCALGYMDLRFAGKWQSGHPKLKRWAKKFDQKYPNLATCLPA